MAARANLIMVVNGEVEKNIMQLKYNIYSGEFLQQTCLFYWIYNILLKFTPFFKCNVAMLVVSLTFYVSLVMLLKLDVSLVTMVVF